MIPNIPISAQISTKTHCLETRGKNLTHSSDTNSQTLSSNYPQLNQINLEPFKSLLLEVCGFTFSSDREQTLRNGICRRMEVCKVYTIAGYYNLLLKEITEINMLIELLTVNETYFFREPKQLYLIVDKLIPELLGKQQKRKIKIVSAGCSTGEEPYSIAMLLYNKYGADSYNLFEIVGVDIDSTAIASAESGVYGKHSFRAIDKSFLERYFIPVEHSSLRIKDTIKKHVLFQIANLNSDLYPPVVWNPDIVLYRNVSIYFHNEVQKAIFSRLADILNIEGYLIVSSTETIHHNIGVLSLIEIDELFVYKKRATKEKVDNNNKHNSVKEKFKKELNSNKSSQSMENKKRECNYKLISKVSTNNLSIKQKTILTIPAAKSANILFSSFESALEYVREHKPEKALTILKYLVEQEPNFIEAHLLLATVLIDAKKFLEAESACHAALSQKQFCLQAYLMLGIIAYQTGRDDEGLRRLREAIYIDSNCWPAYFYFAETVNVLGDKKRAIKSYQSALEILEKDALAECEKRLFPLKFNTEQFKTLCRHKLKLLLKNG